MKYLTYLFFILLSLGQLGRISFLNNSINIYLHEILMLFIIFFNFSVKKISLSDLKKNLQRRNYLQGIFLFIIVLLVSWISSFDKYDSFVNFVSFNYLLKVILYLLFFASLVLSLEKKPEYLSHIKQGFITFSALTIFFSVSQYFLYPDLRNLYYLGWDPHYARIFGLFFDTTQSAAIYSMLSLFFIWVSAKKNKQPRIIWAFIFIILLFLTYSRANYLAFSAAFIYLLKDRLVFKKIITIIFLFGMTLIFLPRPFGEGVKLERVFSIYSRIEDQREGLALWKENPILGVGYNRIFHFKQGSNGIIPDNSDSAFSSSYITILASGGLLLFAAFVYLGKQLFMASNSFGQSLIIFTSILAFFDNVIFMSFFLIIFLTLASLSVSRR